MQVICRNTLFRSGLHELYTGLPAHRRKALRAISIIEVTHATEIPLLFLDIQSIILNKHSHEHTAILITRLPALLRSPSLRNWVLDASSSTDKILMQLFKSARAPYSLAALTQALSQNILSDWFTPREMQVVRLIIRGFDIPQIARHLDICDKTAYGFGHALKEKLEQNSLPRMIHHLRSYDKTRRLAWNDFSEDGLPVEISEKAWQPARSWVQRAHNALQLPRPM